MPHPPVSAVLFDMDGLMIDSEKLYTIVTNRILAPYGREMTWEIKAGLMGRPALDSAAYLIAATDLPLTPQELLDKMDAQLLEAFKTVEILPGVLKLVQHLKAHNVPMAIATGSKARNFAVKSAHLPHLFEPFGSRILCGDDPILEGKGKPDPTIFIVAARLHLGIDTPEGRSKVLVFEDGAPGVRAARAAGMEVCWIPDPELLATMGDSHDLTPSHTHTSMEDFDPAAWGLPPYSS
ncbi:HAD-like domain-containing protein [Leucosporidium creatinivorum]|uniref:HAD-like domain-containing protein n=1 Tax=Leucosporidium creatinivorum TaxID=106004 RepID=A0A1Y2EXV0_9BASI|nr:HAD-like domain-containing protein [Leucosporidium creatinivorum]